MLQLRRNASGVSGNALGLRSAVGRQRAGTTTALSANGPRWSDQPRDSNPNPLLRYFIPVSHMTVAMVASAARCRFDARRSSAARSLLLQLLIILDVGEGDLRPAFLFVKRRLKAELAMKTGEPSRSAAHREG